VAPDALTATVEPVGPATGTPTGQVTFAVGGDPVGTATLVDGVATLAHALPAGSSRSVSAAYAGDARFSAASASTARNDPTITATVTSAQPRSRFGWYRTPVTVSFRCTTQGAPLIAACPAPVRLAGEGAGQSVTRTILATDGGAATVTVGGIHIDRTRPVVAIAGVRDGATYGGAAPRATCVSRDRLSGIASCRITRDRVGDRLVLRATATDRAGNRATTVERVTVLRAYLEGARFQDGAFTVRAGRTYTFVVHGVRRPTYFAAAPAPVVPFRRLTTMYAAGPGRWTLGVTFSPAMRGKVWHLGAGGARPQHVVAVRVVRR
jgi:hypothetical protein